MKINLYKLLSDPFGLGLPEPDNDFDTPSDSEADFPSGHISLDRLLWDKEEKLILLKIDSIKEKNSTRNNIVSTIENFSFAVYIAMAAFLSGIFSVAPKFILSMYILSFCFFVGVVATIIRLRIMREHAEKSHDFDTRGLIYFMANDKQKAYEYFEKSKSPLEILSKASIMFSNTLTILVNWTLIIGMCLMAFLSFQIINSNTTRPFSGKWHTPSLRDGSNHYAVYRPEQYKIRSQRECVRFCL